MGRIQRALVSVSDKGGLGGFVKDLAGMGVKIISTGGTAKLLRGEGIDVMDISDFTGFPEMMDGRVKTLHPKVHGGLLNLRENPEHQRAKAENAIEDIDLVVVNLYPFEATVAKEGVAVEEAVEQIDIGGPSMLRSAAKNHAYVTVVVDPADYKVVLDEMRAHDGDTTIETRRKLACKVFSRTAAYDAAIATWLEGAFLGGTQALRAGAPLAATLRYGENPHQKAAFFREAVAPKEPSAAFAKQLGGKELSFNNYLDLEAALEIVKDFADPAASVIKHTNPCGAAVGADLVDAFRRAYAGDPVSAFGSIVGLNREVDEGAADALAMKDSFLEAVIAPSFTKGAVNVLTTKCKWGRNVRLMEAGALTGSRDASERDVRKILGGWLVQDRDAVGEADFAELHVATKRKPTDAEIADLRFAWVITKHVKSNAIVFVKDRAIVGTGAGQMSRVDSTEIARMKAGDRAKGAALGSDAFFPFPDAVEIAAKAGITAIIQPGGAKRDKEVVAACDANGVAMVLTGRRHFRH